MPSSYRLLGRHLASVALAFTVGATLPAAVGAASGKTPAQPAATRAPAPSRATKSAVPASVRHTLPFLSDDYDRAVAEAKSRQVPIFVESWAPW